MAVPEIDVDTLEQRRSAGAALFDVREPDEYEEGHVPGAVLVPLATLPDSLDRLPTNETVYIICASGNRSRRAAEFLNAQGFDAVNVDGGTQAWIAAGKPHVEGMTAG